MSMKTLALAGALAFACSGSAFAQTAARGGSAEGNMNNPASVKSNSEKSMERSGTTGSTMAPAGTPGTPGAPNTATTVAPGTGGNGVTGSGTAPSGR